MSRILKVLIVLLTITAVVAPAVFAEDRLSLSGQMRVRGFYLQDYDFDDSADETNAFWDQRLRVAGTLAVAEGVAIKFRTDVTESTWGGNDSFSTVTGKNNTRYASQQWDKAYIELKKDMFTVMAGQQYFALGRGIAVDHIGAGVTVMMNSAIPVKLIYTKMDENDSVTNELAHDTDLYGAQISHKTDLYAANVFFATEQFGSTDGQEAYLAGTDFSFNLDAAKIIAELDYFFGDLDSDNDYFGTQLYLDGSMAVSETVTVGIMGLFALGTDDNDEAQLTRLPGSVFADWMPEAYGPFSTEFEATPGTKDIMDFTGDSAGIIAGSLYTSIKATDELTLTFAGMYGTPQDDGITGVGDDIDSFYTLNAGAVYQLMANTQIQAQLNAAGLDGNSSVADDTAFGAMWGLFVKF